MKNYQQMAVRNNNILFVIVLVFGCLTLSASAQDSDTSSIYYLLDIDKTPVQDKMWTIHQEGPYTFYDIGCPCLENGHTPTLYTKKPLETFSIDAEDLKSKKIITLPALLKRLREIHLKSDNTTPPIYIIQKKNLEYIVVKTTIYLPRLTNSVN
jgi:hypothetical protein